MSHDSPNASLSEASSAGEANVGLDHEDHSMHGRMILSAKYVQESRGKKDLIQRLRRVVHLLHDDETVEPDSPDFPGLPALCQALMTYLPHRDKQVRLYTVSACMELFTVYAPDAPWSTQEVLEIFRQTIRQLANLAHTTNRNSPHFNDYERILDLLAQVKIAVILVEMTKEDNCREEALPVLADLFKTLLQSVRKEHPPQIPELIQQTLCGCLEEFHDGIMLPIPLIDELLVCVGQGSRVLVVNPNKALHKNQPLVEQTNPSFLVASSVIRSSVDRLATPIAALLNGLLNTDPRLMEESTISTQPTKELGKPAPQDQDMSADVFNIIYELHRVAPMVLTTIIGTLANFLESSHQEQRQWVIELLGRLFQQQPKFAEQFRACFRQWTERAKDKASEIRKIMVHHLVQLIVVCKSEYASVLQEAQTALKGMLVEDPDPQIRLACIHGICDKAYAHPSAVSVELLLSVGHKIGTKQKQERKDALTGLVQTYFQHYMLPRLEKVVQGGEDVSVQVVQETLEDTQLFESPQENYRIKFEWIPTKVFEAASFQDDTDLNLRVWQAMDDMLLGSEISSKRKLTSTARAVGLAMIVGNLEENALAWLGGMLRERARLQRKLMEYMGARALIREFQPGSEEYLTANANALDILEEVATFLHVSTGTAGERDPTLEKFHGIRDKHIFRILAAVASPTHSTKSRIRAIEEPAKRLKDHGEPVVKFVRVLVRKCAMGDFINQEIVHHCILLAQECGLQDDWESCRRFLDCVQLAAEHFPDVCADEQCFTTLTELFSTCRSSKVKGLKDIVTSLSAILAKAASKNQSKESTSESSLHKDLLRLCRDGAPEQARHAVKTLTAMIHTRSKDSSGSLDSLLNSLANPSILASSASRERLVSSLAALAEFAEAAPRTMISHRGQQAVKFALESVLLGRGNSRSDKDLSDDNDHGHEDFLGKDGRKSSTKPQHQRNAKKSHLSPGGSHDLLEDKDLTWTCRKLCGAIEFLTSCTRATCFSINNAPPQGGTTVSSPPSDGIEKLFEALCKVLLDEGMPPSKRDRQECTSQRDRAALRQCAAISLLRLCDPRLGLDNKYLGTSRWHILASVFLDDEREVREKVIAELGLMLTGHGKYGKSCGFGMAMPPRAKFFALVVLCPDGENAASNGNAANVGKLASHAKINALSCVNSMRAKFEVEAEQARANGPAAEQEFERGGMKFSLMPEYVVPYAFHLLAFRKETPVGSLPMDATTESDDGSDDEGCVAANETQYRMLRKRLKWLFDPLVLSLGDSADNISFLISMSTKLARFAPVGLSPTTPFDAKAYTRLQAVCEVSRSVLMTLYVKKDINLAPFPGQIMIPTMLYKKSPAKTLATQPSASPRLSSRQAKQPHCMSPPPQEGARKSTKDMPEPQGSFDNTGLSPSKGQTSNDSLQLPRRRSRAGNLEEVNHIHFSPRLSLRTIQGDTSFGELSPVERRLSTDDIPGDLLDSGEKTRGSTPPSVVRDMTFGGTSLSTQHVNLSASVTQSPSSKASDGKKSLRSTRRRSPRLVYVNEPDSASPDSASPTNSQPVDDARPHAEVSIEKKPAKNLSRKQSLPEQINRPLIPAKHQSRKRASRNEFDLDFAASGPLAKKASNAKTNKDKENNSQPGTRAPRPLIKI